MTLRKIIIIVLSLTAVGGVLGAGVGGFLGIYTPALYRSMFEVEDTVGFGIGIGIANGMILGFVLGALAVVCLSFGRFNKNPLSPRGEEGNRG